jgi:hypothetical protein
VLRRAICHERDHTAHIKNSFNPVMVESRHSINPIFT